MEAVPVVKTPEEWKCLYCEAGDAMLPDIARRTMFYEYESAENVPMVIYRVPAGCLRCEVEDFIFLVQPAY